ncbi:hypothetical protein AVEN_30817-1 [Araneus ventricosus]|uniref:Uncharacterized protein n=1 Tax=Araneus ventricosus TaxID=182803 RepID=A0A4Y2KTZ0_ARAVE|nr:hypothetical protein AVEN_30817-1 [Araneus ventricosus]
MLWVSYAFFKLRDVRNRCAQNATADTIKPGEDKTECPLPHVPCLMPLRQPNRLGRRQDRQIKSKPCNVTTFGPEVSNPIFNAVVFFCLRYS